MPYHLCGHFSALEAADPVEEAFQALEAHEDASVRAQAALLRKARATTLATIREARQGSSTAALQARILNSIDRVVAELEQDLAARMRTDGLDAARLGYQAVDFGLPRNVSPLELTADFVRGVEDYQTHQAMRVTAGLRGDIRQIIQVAALTGDDMRTVQRRIAGTGIQATGPFRTAEQRAEAIARTELNRLANMTGQYRLAAAGETVPGLLKEWSSARDARVREDHKRAHGQQVPVDGYYTVGGHKGLYPGDPNLPPEQSIRCRCRSRPRVPAPTD